MVRRPANKMTMSDSSDQKEWSLPIVWILLVIGVVVFLAYRYGWWWLGVAVALYFGIAIVSILVRGFMDRRKEGWLQSLRLPLYGLYHIENLEQSSKGGYLYDIVPGFEDKYKEKEQDEIIQSIERAIEEANIDFNEVLPNLPFSREEINFHLKETLKGLKAGD